MNNFMNAGEHMYAERIGGLKSSAIREILKVIAKPGMISLAGGLPAPELFPLEEFAAAAHTVVTKYGTSALQYSITEGLVPLREKIVKMLDPEGGGLGIHNVLITQGSQQGLDLLSKLYLDEGSIIFTENPTYLGALQAFNLFQPAIVPIQSDEEGIQPDKLEERLNTQRPKFLYLMPNFQNPTGVTLSMERRLQVAEIARNYNLLIIEDDPYSELRFRGEKLPSLFSLAGPAHVIYLSSFSKTIAPGLRIAYAAGDEAVMGKLVMVKQGTDLQTNTFGQYVVNEFLASGSFQTHLQLLRKTYGQRRDCMVSALEKYFPKSVHWSQPAGGMFLWVTLPEAYDTRDLLVRCLEKNVAFVPGQEFFPDGAGRNTMRLNFSNATPEMIEEAIRRIGEVLRGI